MMEKNVGMPEELFKTEYSDKKIYYTNYPSSSDILYPPDNFMYDYVSSYIVQFYALLIKYRDGMVIHRYTNGNSYPEDARNEEVVEFDDLKNIFSGMIPKWDFRGFPDDFAFIGESDFHYWFLYYDQDVSDCSVGRVLKKNWSYEEFLEYVKKMCQDYPYEIFKLDGKEHFVTF